MLFSYKAIKILTQNYVAVVKMGNNNFKDVEREEVPEIEKTDNEATDAMVEGKEDVDKEDVKKDVESDDDDFYTVKSRATTRSRDPKASTGILIFSNFKTMKE